MQPVRSAYLDAASAAVDLLCVEGLADLWEAESILAGWPTSVLAGHLARSLLQVEWFLDAAEPAAATISAVDYSALLGVRDPASPLNRGVRNRSEETAAVGWRQLRADVAACLERLQTRLPSEPAGRWSTHSDGRCCSTSTCARASSS